MPALPPPLPPRQHPHRLSRRSTESASQIVIPVVVVVVLLLAGAVTIYYKRRKLRRAAEATASAARGTPLGSRTGTQEPQPLAVTAEDLVGRERSREREERERRREERRRSRRNRERRSSQSSQRTLPLYSEEVAHDEMVLVSHLKSSTPSPPGSPITHERSPSDGSALTGGSHAEHSALLARSSSVSAPDSPPSSTDHHPTLSAAQPATPTLHQPELRRMSSPLSPQHRASLISLPSALPTSPPSPPPAPAPQPRRPSFFSLLRSSHSASSTAASNSTTGVPLTRTRSSRASSIGSSLTLSLTGHSRLSSEDAQRASVSADRSRSGSLGGLPMSPSQISLAGGISAPLQHTLVASNYSYPRSGLTSQQMSYLASSESLGTFGVPFVDSSSASSSTPNPNPTATPTSSLAPLPTSGAAADEPRPPPFEPLQIHTADEDPYDVPPPGSPDREVPMPSVSISQLSVRESNTGAGTGTGAGSATGSATGSGSGSESGSAREGQPRLALNPAVARISVTPATPTTATSTARSSVASFETAEEGEAPPGSEAAARSDPEATAGGAAKS